MPVSLQPLTINYLLDTRRYLALAIGIGAVALGLAVFAVLPQTQAILDLNTQRVNESAKLIKLQKKAAQLQTVNDPQIQAQSNLVNLLLPARKPLVELLGSLNNSATATGVKVNQVVLAPGNIATDSADFATEIANQTGPAGSLDVDVMLDGTLAQLNSFFTAIEKTTPLITITELSLDPVKDANTTSAGSTTASASAGVFDQKYTAQLVLRASYYTRSVTSNLDTDLPQVTVDEQKILDELTTFTVVPDVTQQQIVGGGLQDLFGLGAPALVQQQ